MTRQEIITDILAACAAITTANGFSVQVKAVKRGIHLAEEFSELPGLSLFNERVETTDLTTATAERVLILHLWGAVKAAHEDYSSLDALAAACLEVMADPDHNPHWQSTTCGNLEIYEGGAGDPLGLFDLEMKITYESPLNTL